MTRRHSPAVYRRRRIVVFGALILVLAAIGVGVWLLIAQPWQGQAAEGELPAQVQTPESEPAASDDPDAQGDDGDSEATGEGEAEGEAEGETAAPAEPEIGPCEAGVLRVEPVTDAATYAAGVMPQLSIQLTNNGAVDCTLNVGSSTQVFTITSGADVWWRSTDCQTEPSDMIVTLAAGQTVTTATPLEWNRTRSSVSTCDQEDRPRAPGGGASYHLTVEIGGVPGTKTAQIMLY